MTPHFPAVGSKDLEKVLKKLGFEVSHTRGSHVVYKRASDNKRAVVPRHSGKILKRKVVATILKSIGLDIEEFTNLL